MKRGRTAAILVGVFTVIIVIILVASFALSALLPAKPAATLTAFSTSAPTLTATPDPCSEQSLSATIAHFEELSREFDDAYRLAQNTSATQLSPVIMNLQRIRRNAESYESPACLAILKQYQLGYMNAAINASLALFSTFGGNENANVTQEQANQAATIVNQQEAVRQQYGVQYAIERARLLGITLTPIPTSPAPLGTPLADFTATP